MPNGHTCSPDGRSQWHPAGRFSIDWVAARVFNAGLPEYHFLIV